MAVYWEPGRPTLLLRYHQQTDNPKVIQQHWYGGKTDPESGSDPWVN
jgi:hypothetical protein